MNKNNFFSYIQYGNHNELLERDKNKICTSIKINEYGDSDFFCNNKCRAFFVKLNSKIMHIWIEQTMICNKCLDLLKKRWKINFKVKIPYLYLSKGQKRKNFESYPLIVDLKNSIDKNKDLSFLLNPEMYWWNEYYCIIGIPEYWLINFKLEKHFLKGSKEQGKENGPDFIFRDLKANKLIGFEIRSYKWNVLETIRTEEQIKKFAIKNVYHSKSFDDQVEELKEIVRQKWNKKYIKTDELYLGIVVHNTLVDYEYYVLELILNKFIKEEKIGFNAIYIL